MKLSFLRVTYFAEYQHDSIQYTRVQKIVLINILEYPIKLEMLKYTCDEILSPFRISSLPIPLVNLTDLWKKFGTRWHTCAKSTIFQICLYEAKLNGNNLNYIYNFHKFLLFPIVSVLLSNIWVCCSYLPMQKWEKMVPRMSFGVISPVISPR